MVRLLTESNIATHRSPIVMEEVTDPDELTKAHARRERFDRNFDWFQEHSTEIFTGYRGKCIVIAGEELFAADTPEEAWSLAEATHPEDEGSFIHYIPKDKAARIYAH
jgi:hypothetical protein